MRLVTTSLVEQVQTPSSLLVPFFTTSIQAGSGNDSIVMSGTGPSSQMTANTIDLGVGTDTIKFATATNADTVTVTSTTVTGAKYVTYQAAANAAAITTGSGADLVVFEEAATGANVIGTHSGNDSLQFLKNARVSNADLGAGNDSVYGAQIVSNGTISGGAGQDTFLISTLSNAAIYGGDAVDSVNITGSYLEQLLTSELAMRPSRSQLVQLAHPLLVVLVTTPSW